MNNIYHSDMMPINDFCSRNRGTYFTKLGPYIRAKNYRPRHDLSAVSSLGYNEIFSGLLIFKWAPRCKRCSEMGVYVCQLFTVIIRYRTCCNRAHDLCVVIWKSSSK